MPPVDGPSLSEPAEPQGAKRTRDWWAHPFGSLPEDYPHVPCPICEEKPSRA